MKAHNTVADWLLKQNSEVLWSVDEKENNALHWAALSGSLDIVEWVVSLDSNILHSLNKGKQNAFHVACAR